MQSKDGEKIWIDISSKIVDVAVQLLSHVWLCNTKDIRMANKLFYSYQNRYKKTDSNKCWPGCGKKKESSYSAGGYVKCCSHFGGEFGSFFKI